MLINVDITSSHVEKAARTLRGSAGPNGVDGNLLQSIILHYGKPSEDLREAIALSIRRQANTTIDWKELRALKAKCSVTLNKDPGRF